MNLKKIFFPLLGLALATVGSAADDAKATTGGVTKVAHIAGMDKAPTVVSQTAPVYPSYLRERGIQGIATVELLVDSTGRVVEAKAVRATVPEFGVQAVAATKQWTFAPAEAEGQPIAARIQVPFEFVMPQVAALESDR
ncbi:energy transducer TonB [Actomonas aquatica]|uniref:Energy transducer TonB n=1 Tax=Actomonas aquatica TaxID=2866162 RepID=A0ABZ1C4T1_9BACT|nr:energy transducer TonB [Opitutus sp. WL0086]WRQ86511.1 energy transducer TonB [Opitutus sp. WL0086]